MDIGKLNGYWEAHEEKEKSLFFFFGHALTCVILVLHQNGICGPCTGSGES